LGKLFERVLDKVIDFTFETPKYPMRFREMLEANKVVIDNLDIKMIPGLKFCRLKLYAIYFVIWNLIILPLALLFHSFLVKLDCHLSIVLAIFFTLLFFGTYKIFEEKVKERMAKKLIKNAWKNYLPHFPYEKYNLEVAQIYKEALDKEIPRQKIEQFVIDRLVASK